jgi:predicted DNA-binding transcriptional regulator YafY
MRRGDRLFRLIQLLRRGRVMTAEAIAKELEVSPRTVYRDITDLMVSGVPVDGERGVGYVLRPGYDLPPLMFGHDEIEALLLGARIVMGCDDEGLARAAEDAVTKIQAVLPPGLAAFAEAVALFAPELPASPALALSPRAVRTAIREHEKVELVYIDGAGARTERIVWPLALVYYGTFWLMCGWCELRQDFRHFRLDRVSDGKPLGDRFPVMRGRRLADFLAQEKERIRAARAQEKRPRRPAAGTQSSRD